MNYSDPLDVAGQQRERAKKLDREKLDDQLAIDDLKWLMSDKRGRRHMYRLLHRANVWGSSFNTNSMTMAFYEGLRHEGLRMIEMLTTHSPDRYLDMLKESKE